MKQALLLLVKEYGFDIKDFEETLVIGVKDIEGNEVDWITYNKQTTEITLKGNTEECNIWFYKTRKDLSKYKIHIFTSRINTIFQLSDSEVLTRRSLISPADWVNIPEE